MPVPTRLGLVTMHTLAKVIQRVATKYALVQEQWLTPEQFQKVVDLLQCIATFLSDVPEYPTE
jgi:hypothetical protein